MKFRFLSAVALSVISTGAAEFPEPHNSEEGQPMPAVEAAAGFQVPPGFHVSLFAAEPEVRNPVAMSWDARGRLWVVENYTYAERAKRFDLSLRDRVLVFEDENGDGRFSSRKVFTDDIQMATSVEIGHGGVWLLCPPRLLFVPDGDRDAVPDGAPVTVLDGFEIPESNYHGFANGLRFGPDGWLYGRCGSSAPAEIDGIPVRGAMWRYHPQRKVFEALASGTTNPWGHDWDPHGELFFINTVNGHLWHAITGAHYVRSHTLDPNPRVYGLIDQHADHWHFDTAQHWTKSRDGAADDFGGGHAHVGMMIYQGDNWPAEYRGKLFTWNMHGRRLNQEILERSGSGYLGRHGADLLLSADPWFRGIELSTGPDGAVFALDWSDTGECHEHSGVHRRSGRIFKIRHGNPQPAAPLDLAKLGETELVDLRTHANEWWVRQAQLELAGRSSAGQKLAAATEKLRSLAEGNLRTHEHLRVLWALHAIGKAPADGWIARLRHPDEHIRTWAIRLLTDEWPLDTVLSQRPPGRAEPEISEALLTEFSRMAREDASGLVRLTLASTLQRLPISRRAMLAAPLLARAEDAADANLPQMLWYGLIPVGESDPAALVKLAADCELPLTRRFIARRLAEDVEKDPGPLTQLLEDTAGRPELFQSDVLAGLSDGLSGWRKARKPASWDLLVTRLKGRPNQDRARDLGVVFGDGRALDEVKKIALDDHADPTARQTALQTLIDSGPPDLREICERLLGTPALATVAIRGLSRFPDPAISGKLAGRYGSLPLSAQAAVIEALVTRPSSATVLLAHVAAGKIPRADITPFHARQILSLGDEALSRTLKEVWGELRESPGANRELIGKLKSQLTPQVLATADLRQGRQLYQAVCAACHVLYGSGGQLGPDLTGSGRDNLDYLLDNIADPSSVVPADFRMTVVQLKDGRVLNGFISEKTERTLTLRNLAESVTLERSEIVSTQESAQSIMPDGLLTSLNETQVRDLIAYLMGKSQVALPDP